MLENTKEIDTEMANITNQSLSSQPLLTVSATTIRPNSLKLVRIKLDKYADLERSRNLAKVKKNNRNLTGSKIQINKDISNMSNVGNATKPMDKKKPMRKMSLKLSKDLANSPLLLC